MTLHQVVCLLDLSLGATEDHEIVGITHEAVAGVVEVPVEAIESNVGQQGGYDPSHNLAKKPSLTIETVISRDYLRPSDGRRPSAQE